MQHTPSSAQQPSQVKRTTSPVQQSSSPVQQSSSQVQHTPSSAQQPSQVKRTTSPVQQSSSPVQQSSSPVQPVQSSSPLQDTLKDVPKRLVFLSREVAFNCSCHRGVGDVSYCTHSMFHVIVRRMSQRLVDLVVAECSDWDAIQRAIATHNPPLATKSRIAQINAFPHSLTPEIARQCDGTAIPVLRQQNV